MRLHELKRRVALADYRIDAAAVADAMIDRHACRRLLLAGIAPTRESAFTQRRPGPAERR